MALVAKVREKDSKEIPLFYVYAAMGLERQHSFQQMILVKCASNVVAAATVAAATALCAHDVCSLQCISAEQTKRDALELQWQIWASTLELPDPKPLLVEHLKQEMLDVAQPGSSLKDNAAMIRFLVRDIVGTDQSGIFDELSS